MVGTRYMPEIVCIREFVIEFQIQLCALWHKFLVILIKFFVIGSRGLFGKYICLDPHMFGTHLEILKASEQICIIVMRLKVAV